MPMELEVVFQLFLSAILGAVMGLERQIRRKEAGIRTYALVCLGATIFTIVSFEFFNFFLDKSALKFDPSGVIQAVAIGIGFLGAGVIFRQPGGVFGLTTAAGLWLAAAIGMAIGVKLYFLAAFATFLTLFILSGFGILEEKFFKEK